MQFDFLFRHPACHCGSAEGQTLVLLQVLFKWRLLMMADGEIDFRGSSSPRSEKRISILWNQPIKTNLMRFSLFPETRLTPSAGIAPDPVTTNKPVLHVYGANAWGWRGWFAIHTWIAAKKTGETDYTVYEVVGWGGYHSQSVMRITRDIPDRYWYGEKLRLLKAHQGEGADRLIAATDEAARAYPGKKLQGFSWLQQQYIYSMGG